MVLFPPPNYSLVSAVMPNPTTPTIQSTLRNLTRSALDLLFPIHCVQCGREGEVICDSCVDGLRKLEHPFCDTCARPGVQGRCGPCQEHPSDINGIRAPYLFEGPVRDAVHRLKYRGWRVAAPLLGGLLAEYLSRHKLPGEVLVPVPLHSSRLRSRGYNQSGLLAREIGKLLEVPVRQDLLKRTNDSLPQVEVRTREQRRANVSGNFEASTEVAGLRVLLVDDVATTGSTLFACASVLKDAGAASVWGLVLAKES